MNVVKSNQITNQTNPENQENSLCNLPCGAVPLLTSMNFNFIARAQLLVLISAVSKDDIMSAACSREQFYLKIEVIGPCWYCVDILPSIDPPSNAFKQST